jgi:quercetin dioxygenase-like cupin family protein
MELINSERLSKISNPKPGSPFRLDIVDSQNKAKDLRGAVAVLSPGNKTPYHYHKRRESIIFVISGTATEIVEGEKLLVKAGDILFIPAMEKHGTENTSDKEFRYLEFFTTMSGPGDLVSV